MSEFTGITGITAATTDAGGSLTEEALARTMEAIMAPRPPHHHVISSRAEPGSLAICSGCGTAVRVPDVWP
jgi:hypothetical protein